MDILKSSLVALLATLFCIRLLRPLASRIGLVDRPGGRKQHSNDVPLIGGIAMFFGFCFSLLSLHVSLVQYRGLMAGCSLLMLIGVLDDLHELSSRLRILGQTLAALFLVIWGGKSVNHLGDLFFLGDLTLGLWSFPVTVFVVLGYLNSMNMVDGQDGLAGGIALGQTLLLLILSLGLQRMQDTQILIILVVLLSVFLSFNMRLPWRSRASVFMGDAGVTFVAFIIAWFGIDLSQANPTLIKPMTVLWILAFPLFDLINVMIHRIYRGRSPFVAARDHLHHVLHMKGLNAMLSTYMLCLFSLGLGLIGLLLNHFHLDEGWQFLGWIIALVGYLLFIKTVREPMSPSPLGIAE